MYETSQIVLSPQILKSSMTIEMIIHKGIDEKARLWQKNDKISTKSQESRRFDKEMSVFLVILKEKQYLCPAKRKQSLEYNEQTS